MKKKLALIIISMDQCFPENGFSGGGHKVTAKLINELISSNLFEIDIYCETSSFSTFEGINAIIPLGKKSFLNNLQEIISTKDYNYILSSDLILPFGNLLLHSNSAKHKSKNTKNKFFTKLAELYRSKNINKQRQAFAKNHNHIFVVSEHLKDDYVQSFGISQERIFVAYPSVDNNVECASTNKEPIFTIGCTIGGGVNKGGHLLLFALKVLSLMQSKKREQLNIRVKLIYQKIHKAFPFKLLIKILNLGKFIEILPKQKDMGKFYRSIDCYILPSLNEAFGLVVTEAASNKVPSIVSSTTGVCELIEDRENGFIFDRKNSKVKNLAQGIIAAYELYYNNPAEYSRISENAYIMSQKLNWTEFANIIINNMKEENAKETIIQKVKS